MEPFINAHKWSVPAQKKKSNVTVLSVRLMYPKSIKCDKMSVFDSLLWKCFHSVWDTTEDIGFGNISEKFLPSNLKAELKIFLFWNIKPILFLMFLSYGKNISKSMMLHTHLCWCENFVQVGSQWFIEV